MTDTELTEDEQQARRRAVVELFPNTPFMGWLGLVYERYDPDDVTVRLPFRAELTNDGAVYHGGVVSAVLDSAGALAAWSNHDFNKGARASTVSMSVQYVGAAKNSDLICHGRTLKRGRELIFSDVAATDGDGRPVAHAVHTYRIV